MTPSWQHIQQELCEAYQRQAAIYTEALEVADHLETTWQQGGDGAGALEQIQALMEPIVQSAAAIAEPRRAWLQSGRTADPPLAAALAQVTGLIQRLQTRIAALEAQATVQIKQLAPELDQLLRGRQMQRAYTAVSRNA